MTATLSYIGWTLIIIALVALVWIVRPAGAEPVARNLPGIVYVIASSKHGPVKIGITTRRRLRARLGEIQNGNPKKLKVYASFRSASPRRLEKQAHTMLATYQTEAEREWYAVNVEDAKRLLRDLSGEKRPGLRAALERWWMRRRLGME